VALHQLTTGASGYDLYDLCIDQETLGTYQYVQNKVHGFSKMHVDANQIKVTFKGIDPVTFKISDLYTVIINRKIKEERD